MKLVDSHCHLEAADDPATLEVISRAQAAGVAHAVVVGQFQGPGDFGGALAVGRAHPGFVTVTMGIHPHEAARAGEDDLRMLRELCALPEVKAVGEAGLDYYYDRSPRQVQREVFARQCALAKELGKPLVVHVRDAHEDCEQVLKEQGISHGVIHCFTGDAKAAAAYLALGFHLSISGVVTYKKTEALQEAVKLAPLERLLVETDSPYLAPIPYRGKKNEPAYVVETAKKLAELKGLTVEEVAAQTTKNAARVFGFPLPA